MGVLLIILKELFRGIFKGIIGFFNNLLKNPKLLIEIIVVLIVCFILYEGFKLESRVNTQQATILKQQQASAAKDAQITQLTNDVATIKTKLAQKNDAQTQISHDVIVTLEHSQKELAALKKTLHNQKNPQAQTTLKLEYAKMLSCAQLAIAVNDEASKVKYETQCQ